VLLTMTTDAERSQVREIEFSAAVVESHDVVNLQVLGRSTGDAAAAVPLLGQFSHLLAACRVPCSSRSLLT
jgi:hypothetical protein